MKQPILDSYSRQARLYPGLLVLLPLGLSLVPSLLRLDVRTLGGILGLMGAVAGFVGVLSLIAELVRDPGKSIEEALWISWGGNPVICRLRHSSTDNSVTTLRLHRKLNQLLGDDLKLPTPSEEKRDPTRADLLYFECLRILKERTRDSTRYPLVFKELASYGFRRNLLGIRKWGVASCLVGTTILLLTAKEHPQGILTDGLLAVEVTLVAVWLFVVKARWVRIPAEAYAKRLLKSAENL